MPSGRIRAYITTAFRWLDEVSYVFLRPGYRSTRPEPDGRHCEKYEDSPGMRGQLFHQFSISFKRCRCRCWRVLRALVPGPRATAGWTHHRKLGSSGPDGLTSATSVAAVMRTAKVSEVLQVRGQVRRPSSASVHLLNERDECRSPHFGQDVSDFH